MTDKFPGKSDRETEQNEATDQSVLAPESAHNHSRRNFAKAGVIAPALLTVGARPAFANMCSISGGGSPGSNQQQPEVCLGLTPGYWKKHINDWPANVDPGYPQMGDLETLDEGSCSPFDHGNPQNSTCSVYYNDGTKFDDVFPGGQEWLLGTKTMGSVRLDGNGDVIPGTKVTGDYYVALDADGNLPTGATTGISLMQVLWFDKTGNVEAKVAFAFHLVAALLNSMKFSTTALGTNGYGYNPAEIIHIYEEAKQGRYPAGNSIAFDPPRPILTLEDLKDTLDYMNNRSPS